MGQAMNKLDDVDILARTLYGEAEAGNDKDAIAIAAVIYNRAKYGRLWPDSVAEVCLQPWQFSCWNVNDPNRQRIMAAEGEWFNICKAIAGTTIRGEMIDPTRRSTHYYETGIKMPKWAKGHKPVMRVLHSRGTAHIFFNDIDTPAPKNAKEALDQIKPLASSKVIASSQIAAGSVATSIGASVVEHNLTQQISDGAAAVTPALPLIQMLAEYAPIVLGVVALLAIGYIVYLRVEARRKGVS